MLTPISIFNIPNYVNNENFTQEIPGMEGLSWTDDNYIVNDAEQAAQIYDAKFTWHESPEMRNCLEASCEDLEDILDYPNCEKEIAAYKEAAPQSFFEAREVINKMIERQCDYNEEVGRDTENYDTAYSYTNVSLSLKAQLDIVTGLNDLEYNKDEIVFSKTSKENAEIAFDAFKFCKQDNEALKKLKELVTEKDVTYEEFHNLYCQIKLDDVLSKPDISEFQDAYDELHNIYNEITDANISLKDLPHSDEKHVPTAKEAEEMLPGLIEKYNRATENTLEVARNIINEWDANYLHGFEYSPEAFKLEFLSRLDIQEYAEDPENPTLDEMLETIESPSNTIYGQVVHWMQLAEEEFDIATNMSEITDGRFAVGQDTQSRMDYDQQRIANAIERAPMIKIAHQLEDYAHKMDWGHFRETLNSLSQDDKKIVHDIITHNAEEQISKVERLENTITNRAGYPEGYYTPKEYFDNYPESPLAEEAENAVKEQIALTMAAYVCIVDGANLDYDIEDAKDGIQAIANTYPFDEKTKAAILSAIPDERPDGKETIHPQTIEVNKLIVHNGIFHADDVLCAAMAKTINPEVEIVRDGRPSQEEIDANGKDGLYVADVGNGKFDHHQKDAAVRDDGEKYAACGLLFNEWKDKLFPENIEAQKYFEDVYIKPLEQADNGIRSNALSQAISDLNPNWDEKDVDINDRFAEAVDFAQAIVAGVQEKSLAQDLSQEIPKDEQSLYKEWSFEQAYNELKSGNQVQNIESPEQEKISLEIGGKQDLLHVAFNDIAQDSREEYAGMCVDRVQERFNSEEKAKSLVLEAYENSPNKEIVSLPEFMPWQQTLASEENEAKFVTYPAMRGGYNLQCVPPSPESFDKKVPLPEEWHENMPEGCNFVHVANFLAAFDTAEHAEQAAEQALEYYQEKAQAQEKTEQIEETPEKDAIGDNQQDSPAVDDKISEIFKNIEQVVNNDIAVESPIHTSNEKDDDKLVLIEGNADAVQNYMAVEEQVYQKIAKICGEPDFEMKNPEVELDQLADKVVEAHSKAIHESFDYVKEQMANLRDEMDLTVEFEQEEPEHDEQDLSNKDDVSHDDWDEH